MKLLLSNAFLFFFFFTSYVGSLAFVFAPAAILIALNLERPLIRYLDFIEKHYFIFPTAFLKYIVGIKFFHYGDQVSPKDKCVMIMNHRTRFDWLYIWSPLLSSDALGNHKIVLKDVLQKIPGAGWCLRVFNFLFLSRKWAEDEKAITRYAKFLKTYFDSYNVLFFPEGTNLSNGTRKKDIEYSIKNDLQLYEEVLHPRTTGFKHLVSELNKLGHIDYIYDIDIAYEGSICQNESDFIAGKVPTAVHIFQKRFSVKEVLQRGTLEDFLMERWNRKDEFLRKFYQDSNSVVNSHTKWPVVPSVKRKEVIFSVLWISLVLAYFILIVPMQPLYNIVVLPVILFIFFNKSSSSFNLIEKFYYE